MLLLFAVLFVVAAVLRVAVAVVALLVVFVIVVLVVAAVSQRFPTGADDVIIADRSLYPCSNHDCL